MCLMSAHSEKSLEDKITLAMQLKFSLNKFWDEKILRNGKNILNHNFLTRRRLGVEECDVIRPRHRPLAQLVARAHDVEGSGLQGQVGDVLVQVELATYE